ncbi:hypothetical protein MMC31_005751 [Peltigera leucophlebia]|nr:hypothetical protein [Peltigera leucophlebia]
MEEMVTIRLMNGLGSSFETYLTMLGQKARDDNKLPDLPGLLSNLDDEERRIKQTTQVNLAQSQGTTSGGGTSSTGGSSSRARGSRGGRGQDARWWERNFGEKNSIATRRVRDACTLTDSPDFPDPPPQPRYETRVKLPHVPKDKWHDAVVYHELEQIGKGAIGSVNRILDLQ